MNYEALLAHEDFIRDLARRLIVDENAADDVTQQTWVAALKEPKTDIQSLPAWLSTVIRNFARKRARSRERRSIREKLAAVPEKLPSAAEIVQREALRKSVVDTLLTLKEPYQSVLIYRFYEDLPPREIARRLGIPVATVHSRIKRGLAQMRGRLDNQLGGDRHAWCLALAPLAGLRPSETASLPAANIFLATVATIIAVVSAIVLLKQPETPPSPSDSFEKQTTYLAFEEDEKKQPGPSREDLPRTPIPYLGAFKGRLLDASGASVAGQWVSISGFRVSDLIQGLSAFQNPAPRFDSGTCTTDENGSFRVADLMPGLFYTLSTDRDRLHTIIDAHPKPGETVDLGDLALPVYTTLSGSVTDNQDKPIPGARIRVTDLPLLFDHGLADFRPGCALLIMANPLFGERRVIEPSPVMFQLLRRFTAPSVISGLDGSFTISGAWTAAASLVVDKTGYRARSISIHHDSTIIRLPKETAVQGRLIDPAGSPVQGAEVRTGPMIGHSGICVLQPQETTGKDGGFAFAGSPASPQYLAIRRRPGDPWTVEGPFRGGDVFLPHASDLEEVVPMQETAARIRVLDPSGAKPLAQAEVFFLQQHPSPAPMEGINALTRNRVKAWFEAAAGPVSSFSNSQGRAVFSGLSPGRYRVTVRYPGYPLHSTALELPCPEEQCLRMEPGGNLEGAITFHGSGLRPPFFLLLEPLEIIRENQNTVHHLHAFGEFPETVLERLALTDREGRFSIRALKPGPWQVRVLPRLFGRSGSELARIITGDPLALAKTEVESGQTAHLQIPLETGASGLPGNISGSIYIDGRAASSAWVGLRSTEIKRYLTLDNLGQVTFTQESSQAPGKEYSTRADALGRYSFRGVTAGGYYLSVRLIDFELSRKITVNESDLAFESFHLHTGAVHGRVVGGAQVMVLGACADLRLEMQTLAGPDGYFRLDGVPEGTYSVLAYCKGRQGAAGEKIEVVPGGVSGPIRITIHPPAGVRGKVLLPPDISEEVLLRIDPADEIHVEQDITFNPVWNCYLTGRSRFPAVDGRTGGFFIEALHPGSYLATWITQDPGKGFLPIRFTVPPEGLENLVLIPRRP